MKISHFDRPLRYSCFRIFNCTFCDISYLPSGYELTPRLLHLQEDNNGVIAHQAFNHGKLCSQRLEAAWFQFASSLNTCISLKPLFCISPSLCLSWCFSFLLRTFEMDGFFVWVWCCVRSNKETKMLLTCKIGYYIIPLRQGAGGGAVLALTNYFNFS